MSEYDMRRRGDGGAYKYAWRMAGYVKDAAYIQAMTLREYRNAPSIERIKAMQAEHAAQSERFAKRHGGRIV